MTDFNKAIVLLSGGLDSATTLAIARDLGFACHALSFAYGQRHLAELDAARRIARQFAAIQHKTIQIVICKQRDSLKAPFVAKV